MDSPFVIALVGYLSIIIGLTWLLSRRQTSGEDFLLGNRDIPMLLTLGTTVATMVGTGSSMGAVGFAYHNGWAGTLYGVGGAMGILLLSWWFAPLRRLRFMTMCEEVAYYTGGNRWVKNLMAFLIYVACIGWLGAHILGGSMYLVWITDIDPLHAKLAIALGFSIYTLIGGYLAVVWTDAIQAIVLFTGFIIIAITAVIKIGGPEVLLTAPSTQANLINPEPFLWLPALSLMLVVAVGVLAAPSFRQRIYSARSVATVRRSFHWSGGIYLVFSFIPAIIGICAYLLAPELENRNFAFPYLAINLLPATLGALFLLAGLSATMSSASSDAIAGVSVLIRDISVAITGKTPQSNSAVAWARMGLVFTVCTATTLASLSDDVVSYITKMIATLMSGIFVCTVLGLFWQRFNAPGAIAALVSGSIASGIVLINSEWLVFWGNPIIPSVGVSLLCAIVITLLTRPNALSRAQTLELLEQERSSLNTTNAPTIVE